MMASTTEDAEERAPCGSPPSNAPRAKRQRLSQTKDDADNGLPAEIWGKVMEFLPLSSVLSSAVVSREMLRTMAFVKMIHIDHSSQMHAVVASRHTAVIEVRIYSLFTVLSHIDNGAHPIIRVDFESSERFVPFLSRFVKLQRVAFDPPSKRGKHYHETDGSLTDVIDSISRAYRCGFFSAGVQVFGLSCPRSHDGVRKGPSRGHCVTCHNACRRFPLHHVVNFECRGSSLMKVKMGRPHGLDVCIPRPRLDENIKDRPGGEEMLYSKDRILKLLGAGSRYKIMSDDGGRILELVKFTGAELLYLQSAIENSPHNVGKLPSQVMYDAITGSLLKEGHDPAHPTSICYLVRESYDFLKGPIALQLDEDLFYGCTKEMVKFLPQISQAIQNQSGGALASTSCIRHLVQINSSCIIQPDMASVMIKEIADRPESNRLVRYEVMQIINVLLQKGSSEYVNFLERPNSDLLAKILSYLLCDDQRLEDVELGLHMLYHHFIATDYTQAIIKAGCSAMLVNLLNSPNRAISDLAMNSLGGIVEMVDTDPSICQAVLDDGILKPLLKRIRTSADENESMVQTGTRILMLLSTCSFYLSHRSSFMLNPTLETLSKLLLKDDHAVLRNCSTAINNILKDRALSKTPLACQLEADVQLQICSNFGKLASNPWVQEVVLEGIYWLTKDRYFTIELATELLPRIKVFVSSSNEAAAFHTCRTVRNIMDCANDNCTESVIQFVLASDVIPILSKALEDVRSNIRREAMLSIVRVAKEGTPSQRIDLVTQGCIDPLCDIIIRDNVELVTHAMKALINILTAMENKTEEVVKSESTITMFQCDIDRIDRQRKRLESLEEMRAWVVVEMMTKELQVRQQIRDSLERQEIEVRLQISCSKSLDGAVRPPGNSILNDRLLKINAEFKEADAECRLKKVEITKLTSEAEAIVPKKEWEGRWGKGHIPVDAIERKLKETEQKVEEMSSSLEARKKEVATAASQLKGLLQQK